MFPDKISLLSLSSKSDYFGLRYQLLRDGSCNLLQPEYHLGIPVARNQKLPLANLKNVIGRIWGSCRIFQALDDQLYGSRDPERQNLPPGKHHSLPSVGGTLFPG